VTPSGKILYRASGNKEEIGIVDINPKEARNKRITQLNDIFKDRREKLYKLL